jgi:hypothetical protein
MPGQAHAEARYKHGGGARRTRNLRLLPYEHLKIIFITDVMANAVSRSLPFALALFMG